MLGKKGKITGKQSKNHNNGFEASFVILFLSQNGAKMLVKVQL